jgi:hypothetical protein
LRITLIANAFLEVGIDRLSTAVSTGFARSKVRKAPRPKEAKGKIRTDVQVAEEASMAVTYCVARPFIRTEDGAAPGEAQDARTPRLAGTLQFRAPVRRPIFGILARPCLVLKKFGDVPEDLSEL